MKPTPRVRFVKAWQTYRVGQFIWPDSAMLRNWLIANGYVVLDEVKPAPVAPASVVARRPRKVVPA